MKMLSPVRKREKPPLNLVFISMFVDMVAMALASTLSVFSPGTCTVT